MAELKTKRTGKSVPAFLKAIDNEQVRADCRTLVDFMQQATDAKPEMWGTSIVGFGTFRYKYASGREGEWPLAAFAPRKNKFTVYIMPGFKDHDQLRARLGPHTGGLSCIHIKRLADVHMPTLKKMVHASMKHVKQMFPPSS